MPCERVVVQELQQILAAAQGKPDEKFAEQLAWLQLSERVSATRLSRWKAQLPGPESRQALTALADVAKFLDLPASELPDKAAPNPGEAVSRAMSCSRAPLLP